MTDRAPETPARLAEEGERLYRLLANHSADVFAVFDMEARAIYVSPSVFQLRGYTPEECLKQITAERLTARSQEVARQAFEEMLAVEQAGQTPRNSFRRLELEQPCKDGSTVWVESTFTWVRDETGRPTGILSVTRDITARKRAEAALEDSEARLREAQKLEAVGRLAGGVAHEFNNLMTVILGRAQWLLTQYGGDATMRGQLEMVERAGQRAAHLTAQLVAFCRRQTFAPRRLDLNDVLRAALPALRRGLPPEVEIVTRLRGGLPPLEADRIQLEHVLQQLVMNARDAMPEGGRIIVETAATAGRGAAPWAVLSVADTGHGMTEEVRARAFEPFFTTKDVGAGTGLGLAMVYGSVQQHGGHLEMDSAPGLGTTVRIHLPGVPAAASRPGFEATVLMVEEDRTTADRLVEVLADRGYTVLAAPGAEEALAVASLHPGAIDLLIADVMLARLNGAELAARLRQTRPSLRTLFVVGDIGEPDPRLVLHAPEGLARPPEVLVPGPAGKSRPRIAGARPARRERPGLKAGRAPTPGSVRWGASSRRSRGCNCTGGRRGGRRV